MTLLRWDFTLNMPMLGFFASPAQGGEQVQVQTQGFLTSDDGPLLYTYLDGFYECVLAHGVPLPPEKIHTALVSIRGGTRVTAIVNPTLRARVLTKVDVKAGDPMFRDQLADVVDMWIPGFDLPDCGALAFLFQIGWRRAFYFDFSAHAPGTQIDAPLGDVSALLGSLHGALLLRDRIRLESNVLNKMAAVGWFPFVRLSKKQSEDLYRHFEYDWDPAKPIATILGEIGPTIPAMVESWGSKPAFAPHLDVLKTGARLFSQQEYVGAASTVLPKLEGVLRHLYAGAVDKPNAPELRRHVVGRMRANVVGYTALLPEAFMSYLETYFYAGFNLNAGVAPPSRNAFMHGVGPDAMLQDPTYCLRLFLTLDQLFFCVSRMKEPPT
jgi:hypothetical protein